MSEETHSSFRQLNIGLDWDGTANTDLEFWGEFIQLAKKFGHKVHIVTFRKETLENIRECDLPGALTYCADCAPKDWHMRQKGIEIDVWIDNEPEKVRTGR